MPGTLLASMPPRLAEVARSASSSCPSITVTWRVGCISEPPPRRWSFTTTVDSVAASPGADAGAGAASGERMAGSRTTASARTRSPAGVSSKARPEPASACCSAWTAVIVPRTGGACRPASRAGAAVMVRPEAWPMRVSVAASGPAGMSKAATAWPGAAAEPWARARGAAQYSRAAKANGCSSWAGERDEEGMDGFPFFRWVVATLVARARKTPQESFSMETNQGPKRRTATGRAWASAASTSSICSRKMPNTRRPAAAGSRRMWPAK